MVIITVTRDALWHLSSSSVVVCNTHRAIIRLVASSPAHARWWHHAVSSL